MVERFLTLGDLVLPPPLPPMVSILMVAGVAGISEWGVRKLQPTAGVPQRAAAFMVVVGTCGALVHALLLAHLATLPALRVLAGVLVAAGCAMLISKVRRVPRLMQSAGHLWGRDPVSERVAMSAVGCTVLGLILAAFGPVTDADSLDYHLGVPLAWLRQGSVALQAHWMHARLAGLGEAVNMLGLAAGTDGLGAAVQVSGLVALMAVMWRLGKTPRDQLFVSLLALPPVLLPLATAQKPQLFPAAAVAVAMILARTAASRFDFALIFGCVAFAAACKLSFLVSGGVVSAATLVWAYKRGTFVAASSCAALAFAMFVLPVLGRNWFLYGDPMSPFLEGFREHPIPEVVQFGLHLQNAGEPHTSEGILVFLRGLVLPSGLGDVQTILGIGLVAILFVTGAQGSGVLLGGFAVVLLFAMWRGQLASRYLLESYFWCAAAAGAAPWCRLKSVLFYGLSLQTLGVAAMSLGSAAMLFPGVLTPGLRDAVMRRSTFGYEEALWMDRVIPRKETIMVDSRAYALFPRPFVIPECAACGADALLHLVKREDFLSGHAGVLVPEYPVDGALPSGCRTTVIAGPERFRYATRNPFNSREYHAVSLRVDCK